MAFAKFKFWRARQAFLSRRGDVYAAMAFSLEHDATPREELRQMHKTAVKRNSALTRIYEHWYTELTGKAAGRISVAMKSTIPTTEFALLASAEETHNLPKGLRFLSESIGQVEQMRASIVGAFGKVRMPVLTMLGLMFGVDAFFFPTIEDSLPRSQWPVLTKGVAFVAAQITSLVGVGLVLAAVLFAAWYFSLSRWTGKTRRAFERTPFYSKYRDFNCALFLVNLAFLMLAEHPPRESLTKIHEHSNPYMRWHIEQMIKKLNKESSNFVDALISTGLFKTELGDLMANYARWGDWHTQIRAIADNALDQVTKDMIKFGSGLEQGLQLALGLCVMVVFASGGLAVVEVLQATGMTR